MSKFPFCKFQISELPNVCEITSKLTSDKMLYVKTLTTDLQTYKHPNTQSQTVCKRANIQTPNPKRFANVQTSKRPISNGLQTCKHPNVRSQSQTVCKRANNAQTSKFPHIQTPKFSGADSFVTNQTPKLPNLPYLHPSQTQPPKKTTNQLRFSFVKIVPIALISDAYFRHPGGES